VMLLTSTSNLLVWLSTSSLVVSSPFQRSSKHRCRSYFPISVKFSTTSLVPIYSYRHSLPQLIQYIFNHFDAVCTNINIIFINCVDYPFFIDIVDNNFADSPKLFLESGFHQNLSMYPIIMLSCPL
jgi:hypothetical protein